MKTLKCDKISDDILLLFFRVYKLLRANNRKGLDIHVRTSDGKHQRVLVHIEKGH